MWPSRRRAHDGYHPELTTEESMKIQDRSYAALTDIVSTRVHRRALLKHASVLGLGVTAVGSLSAQRSAAARAQDEPMTIGVSYPTANNAFWTRYTDFMTQVADALDIELILVDANNDEEKQVADVESLISQGVNGLVVTPQSTAIAAQLLRTAEEARVPVMFTDRFPGIEPDEYEGESYVGFIGPNDEQAGYDIATHLIVNEGRSKLVGLGGLPGSSVAEGRKAGLERAVAEHGATLVQYEGIGETREVGLQTMESILSAQPSGAIDAVWGYNDELALGALKAAQNAGRAEELAIGGMDLNEDAVNAIKAGDLEFSTGGHWLQGGFGLITLYDALHGVEPAERIIKLDLLGVDKTNVDQFLEEFVNNPPSYDIPNLSRANNPDAATYFEITLGGDAATASPTS
jgi:ABC-type sugar transport system substrate-binding protein